MTPLANYYIKQQCLPARDRDPIRSTDEIDMATLVPGCRCFEVTDVLPLIRDLGEVTKKSRMESAPTDTIETFAFLPAPKTWIEHKNANGRREAILMVSEGDHDATLYVFVQGAGARVARLNLNKFLQYESDNKMDVSEVSLVGFAYLALAIINSPRIVEQHNQPANKGLQKLVNRTAKTPFELLPWTEIKLNVTKPEAIDDGEPHAASISGRRALHFCRAHIRIKRGKIEYVTSHWRGDAALGIRQSDYRLK